MLTFKDVSFSSRAEWLAWRQKGIGSSDAPIIMGYHEYSTPLKLYEQKLLPFPKDYQTYATEKGNEAEPKIRSLAELKLGKSFKAVCCECEEMPILISYDGRSQDRTEHMEIKLINKKDWQFAKDLQGELLDNALVPKQYEAQVQHQFLGSTKVCWFVMYRFDAYKNNPLKLTLENMVILKVTPEPDYMGKMLNEHQKFWNYVTHRMPPVPSDKDYEPLAKAGAIAKKWLAAKQKADKADVELAEARKALIELADKTNHPRLWAAGVRMTLTTRTGSVDYSKIPELNGVDLEKYRKPGSASWTIAPTTMGENRGETKQKTTKTGGK